MNSLIQKPSHPLAKTKTLVKSLMNRAELLLHVTIAAQSGLTRSISGTPAETPGTAHSQLSTGSLASPFKKYTLATQANRKHSCVFPEKEISAFLILPFTFFSQEVLFLEFVWILSQLSLGVPPYPFVFLGSITGTP